MLVWGLLPSHPHSPSYASELLHKRRRVELVPSVAQWRSYYQTRPSNVVLMTILEEMLIGGSGREEQPRRTGKTLMRTRSLRGGNTGGSGREEQPTRTGKTLVRTRSLLFAHTKTSNGSQTAQPKYAPLVQHSMHALFAGYPSH